MLFLFRDPVSDLGTPSTIGCTIGSEVLGQVDLRYHLYKVTIPNHNATWIPHKQRYVLYVHVTPALSPAQSGFRRGDSTQYQVTRLVQDIVTHRHKKDHVGIVFFDLAKAFDTVWHRGLLAKLETVFLIEGQMINWIASYLSSRNQVVRVSSVLSEPLLVTSGVPRVPFSVLYCSCCM